MFKGMGDMLKQASQMKEKMAEMQEELLWFGEACHMPVIWASCSSAT